MTTPQAVLLDADGVVQQNPDGWLDDLKSFVGPDDGQDFVDDLFATEAAAMTGHRTFPDVLAEVAARWGAANRSDELLEHWRRIEVSEPTVALATELRDGGVPCYLATNQHAVRASYMKDVLGYGELFDGVYCSCDLGVLKSSATFFTQVLDRLGLDAGVVLFVDDSEEYVRSARAAGLQAETWSIDDGVDVLRERMRALGLPV